MGNSNSGIKSNNNKEKFKNIRSRIEGLFINNRTNNFSEESINLPQILNNISLSPDITQTKTYIVKKKLI